jgi:diguanylate cyclase (GGDEF)-like protein
VAEAYTLTPSLAAPALPQPSSSGEEAVSATAPIEDLQRTSAELDHRDLSLWMTTISVLVLLCAVIFLMAFPAVWARQQFVNQEQVEPLMKGLFGVVLIFSVFVLYRQRATRQLRKKLQIQIAAVAEAHGRTETVERLAILDPLTGLFNRRFVDEHLSREIARCDRDNQPLIVAIIELDNFQTTVDRFGMAAGDAVLGQFAHHIKKAIRSADLPVRIEGNKFLLILPECAVRDVYRPLERLHGCEVRQGAENIPVHFTVAWVQRRENEPAAELMRRAEEALQKQKHSSTRA